jgi:hypothetical protein
MCGVVGGRPVHFELDTARIKRKTSPCTHANPIYHAVLHSAPMSLRSRASLQGLTTSALAIELGLGNCDAFSTTSTTASAVIVAQETSTTLPESSAADTTVITSAQTDATTTQEVTDSTAAQTDDTTTTANIVTTTAIAPTTTESECQDDATFVDASNYSCAEWHTFSCYLAAAAFGYTQQQQASLIFHCPRSCRLCNDITTAAAAQMPTTTASVTTGSSTSGNVDTSSSSPTTDAVDASTTTPDQVAPAANETTDATGAETPMLSTSGPVTNATRPSCIVNGSVIALRASPHAHSNRAL